MAAGASFSQSPNDVITKWRTVWNFKMFKNMYGLSDPSSSDPSIRSWTATKWLGSDFCLPQVLEEGLVRTQRTPPPYGPGVT